MLRENIPGPEVSLQQAVRLALAAAILFRTAATANAQSVMKQCGEQWQAARAAGTTNGANWPQFLAQCRAQLSSGAKTAAPTPAPAQPQTGCPFPWQQPAAPTRTAAPTTAVSNQSVMKQCGAQWQSAKAAGTTNGETWPLFLKECRSRLASTTSAPPQADLPRQQQRRLPLPLQRRRNRVHCSRGNSLQRQPLPRLEQAGLRLRRKLSTGAPERPSSGSTSTRTSITSLERGITAIRNEVLICVRLMRRRLATAPQRTSAILKVRSNPSVRHRRGEIVYRHYDPQNPASSDPVILG
jgi:hypothetical protein